ncbi:MAG: acetate--CoA ligase family protein [Candidatus Ranarchaeia archaeon]
MAIKHIFEPKNVAVIGASTDPNKLGYKILENILKAGFKGDIFPINPKASEVQGLKAYPSILEVPESDIDFAVLIIPARFVPATMEQCGQKKVKGAVVISGGFSEAGNVADEEAFLEVAKKYGIRIIGPNCQGINNPHVGLNATWPLITARGPISVISQSGTVYATLEMWAEEEGIGISKAAALGNKRDVDEIDLVRYFGQDPLTKVAAVYSEGISNGREFMDVLKESTKKTPVIILKPGRTEAGAKAVLSHTKSLAGKDAVYEAAFKQCGAIRAKTLEDLYDMSKALAFLPPLKGRRLLIVTSSGGAGILAADIAEESGFTMPPLPEDIKEKLKEELPGFCVLKNPLDLTGSAYSELYETVLKHTLGSDQYDGYLLIYGDPIPDACKLATPLIKGQEKPVAISYLGGGDVQPEEIQAFHREGIPVFPTSERAVIGLKALVEYQEFLETV